MEVGFIQIVMATERLLKEQQRPGCSPVVESFFAVDLHKPHSIPALFAPCSPRCQSLFLHPSLSPLITHFRLPYCAIHCASLCPHPPLHTSAPAPSTLPYFGTSYCLTHCAAPWLQVNNPTFSPGSHQGEPIGSQGTTTGRAGQC